MKSLSYLDWSVVEQPNNPVFGDTEEIALMAGKYKSLSRDFSEMVSALNNLGTNAGMCGDWVAKFEDKEQELPHDFARFAEGFAEVAKQLRGWMWSLDGFQTRAKAQLERAIEARDEHTKYSRLCAGAHSTLSQAESVVEDLSDDATDSQRKNACEARDAARRMLDGYDAQVRRAGNAWDDAKRVVRDIRAEYEHEAHDRAVKISAAQESTPSVNGIEKFHYSDGWQLIVSVAKVAAVVLSIVSLFTFGWGIALAVVLVGALLFSDKIVEGLYGDASWKEVAVEGLFFLLSFLGSVRCIGAGLKGFKTASAAKSTGLFSDLKDFGMASKNVATNLKECHSMTSVGILAQYSNILPTSAKVTEGMTLVGDVKKTVNSVRVIAGQVRKWGSNGKTLKTVLYYAGREHLVQKTVNVIGYTHDFVLDQVEYGRQTSGPWDVMRKFIPGLAQWDDASDAANNLGESVGYAESTIRSFAMAR